jgi:hypothetical protein
LAGAAIGDLHESAEVHLVADETAPHRIRTPPEFL